MSILLKDELHNIANIYEANCNNSIESAGLRNNSATKLLKELSNETANAMRAIADAMASVQDKA